MDIQRIRADTPGCADRIHLNNAGSALMPSGVLNVIRDHLTLESQLGGYEAAEDRRTAIEATYQSVATLLHTHSKNIAFTENATASYIQALSSISFQRNDVILTTRNDYVSNQIQFLSLQKRLGVRVVRAPDRVEGGVDVAAMSDLIREHKPRLVCVTHVPTNSGLVQDICAVGSVCQQESVLYLVDACQSVGQIPIDVNSVGCDFLSATSRKFLRGPRGAGFLFVSDRVLRDGLEPLYIDLRGADWLASEEYRAADTAKRFENWEFAWALVLGTGEAARYALSIGVEEIQTRVRDLGNHLRTSLESLERVRVLDRGEDLTCIVTAWVDGWKVDDLAAVLRQRRINTQAQGLTDAFIDYDAKGVAGSLRISPHYYNTREEIDEAVSVIEELVSERS